MNYKKIKNKFIKAIVNRPIPKIICLIIAIIVWFAVMENINPEVNRTFKGLQVETIGLERLENNNLILKEIKNDQIDVTVRGKWKDIMRLKDSDIEITSDIGYDYSKGDLVRRIDTKVNYLNVSIVGLSNNTITLSIDSIETEEKPIKIVTTGSEKEGLNLVGIKPKEEKISVTGPSELLNSIATLEGVINISEFDTTTEEQIKLVAKNVEGNEVKDVKLEKPFVDVEIGFNVVKTVPLVVKVEGDVSNNSRYIESQTNIQKITIEGDSKVLSGINEINSKPISLIGKSASFETNLELNIPKGVKLVTKDTLNAKIIISALETKFFKIKSDNVEIVNKVEDFNYTFLPELSDFKVSVTDIRSVLTDIKVENIKLKVDVDSLTSGEYKLPITATGIPESSVYSISTDSKLIIE